MNKILLVAVAFVVGVVAAGGTIYFLVGNDLAIANEVRSALGDQAYTAKGGTIVSRLAVSCPPAPTPIPTPLGVPSKPTTYSCGYNPAVGGVQSTEAFGYFCAPSYELTALSQGSTIETLEEVLKVVSITLTSGEEVQIEGCRKEEWNAATGKCAGSTETGKISISKSTGRMYSTFTFHNRVKVELFSTWANQNGLKSAIVKISSK